MSKCSPRGSCHFPVPKTAGDEARVGECAGKRRIPRWGAASMATALRHRGQSALDGPIGIRGKIDGDNPGGG
jgi:hypothetical protein